MIRLANTQLWVHDQDEALAWYTEKLGMEVRADVTTDWQGTFRWLTVGPPGQDDVSIVLMSPALLGEETAKDVLAVVARGLAGTLFLTTADCQATYEELRARGVEFVETPHDTPYGIDSSFRDPSGNHIRLTQVREYAAV